MSLCPSCGVENPDSNLKCACGYDSNEANSKPFDEQYKQSFKSKTYTKKYGIGWGWLVLFGMLEKPLELLEKGKITLHPIALVILLALFVVMMFSYFRFRKRAYNRVINTANSLWVESAKIGFACFAIYLALFYSVIFANAYISKPSIEKMIADTAEKQNKLCPKKVENIETYRVDAKGKTLIYNCKIVDLAKNEIPNDSKESFFKEQKTTFCANNEIKQLLDAGVTIQYSYKDKNNAMFDTITYDKTTCN